MSFYIYDPSMGSFLRQLIDQFENECRPNLHKKVSITWVCYTAEDGDSLSSVRGAGWLEEKPIYPASVVKLFYACAIENWLYRDLLIESSELRRAMTEMITNSSNDATSYIVDLLTATTSGPALKGQRWEVWKKKRNFVNAWLSSFNWQEFRSINCCQKTWGDGPFGRDSDFYGDRGQNRNSLTTIATAKLMHELINGSFLMPNATQNLKRILNRSLDLLKRKENPDNQVDGFLGEGLPTGSNLWSKAGLMSEVRHDAAYFETPKGHRMLLIVFTQGRNLARDTLLLPSFASELSQWSLK